MATIHDALHLLHLESAVRKKTTTATKSTNPTTTTTTTKVVTKTKTSAGKNVRLFLQWSSTYVVGMDGLGEQRVISEEVRRISCRQSTMHAGQRSISMSSPLINKSTKEKKKTHNAPPYTPSHAPPTTHAPHANSPSAPSATNDATDDNYRHAAVCTSAARCSTGSCA